MGLYDYFEPDPPIPCPYCDGSMAGWQGKHWGDCCLFVWRQGDASPIEHRVDEDCRLEGERLGKMRLEKDVIPISGGECNRWGTKWWNSAHRISADARSGIWMTTIIDPAPLTGTLIEGEWIQCPNCADAIQFAEGQMLAICKPCSRLVQRPAKAV